MNLDAVRRSLEPGIGAEALFAAGLPAKLFDSFLLCGLRIDLNVPGRVLCSISVPPRFVNSSGVVHGGLIASLVDLVGMAVLFRADSPLRGLTTEINFSYINAAFDNEEIEVDGQSLKSANPIGVAAVEIRNKKTGKIIAQARLSKDFSGSSKL